MSEAQPTKPKADSSADRSNRSWKNILIDRKFQLKFVAWASLSGLILGVFYNLLMTAFLKRSFVAVLETSTLSDMARQQLMSALDAILFDALLFTGVFVLFCAAWGLIFSHRTAGPLFNLRSAFQRATTGDLSIRCQFRKDDELKEVAEDFNQMMDAVEARSSKSSTAH